MEGKYKILSRVAKQCLGVPATSVASEQVFSTEGNKVTAQRACLSGDNVDMLVLLTKNTIIPEDLNPFPNKPWFLRVCSTSLLKTLWEKEKLLITSNFSFSHSVFYLFRTLSAIFIKNEIVVCKLFQFGRV